MCLVQTMANKLSTWLNYECRSRGWSHRQLGEKSGISGAMISRVIAEKQPAGWDFCVGVASALGKDPVEVFRLAGLLPEESHGENEPALLHHYRQLTPANQSAALAMLRGLAGQPAPAQVAPALGADVDSVCKLLARLDTDRLNQVADFIRWLIEQPGTAGPPKSAGVTWDDFERALASLPSEKRKNAAMNLLRRFARQADYDLHTPGDIDSESDQAPGRGLAQGNLF